MQVVIAQSLMSLHRQALAGLLLVSAHSGHAMVAEQWPWSMCSSFACSLTHTLTHLGPSHCLAPAVACLLVFHTPASKPSNTMTMLRIVSSSVCTSPALCPPRTKLVLL